MPPNETMQAESDAPRDESMLILSIPTLRAKVAERLREALIGGRFPPGTRLVERELCELMQISRGSLREALRELEHEGLVKSVPNKGLIVAVLDYKTAKSIYEVRAALESLAAAQFTRNATVEQIRRLKKAIDALKTATNSKSPQAMLEAKHQFDDILLEGADNEIAMAMLQTIKYRVAQLRITSLSQPGRGKIVMSEMDELYRAIVSRDEERARKACAAHIYNASLVALEYLKKAEGEALPSKPKK